MKEIRLSTKDQNYITSGIKYISDELSRLNKDVKEVRKTELLCEEAMLKLSKHVHEDAELSIRFSRKYGKAFVEISSKGDEIHELSDGSNITYAAGSLGNDDIELDTGLLILKANKDMVKYDHNNGVNLIRIMTGKSENSTMQLTLISLIASIIIGLIFRQFVPAPVNAALCDYVFLPIRTMFINALKIIVGPVVFFSIVTCISQFSNLSELGKIGVKVVTLYFFTTVIAVCVGIGMESLISPGQWGGALVNGPTNFEASIKEVDTSIIGTIVNIVPGNILKPFVESDTLQIIFLAILLGVAVGMIGNYSRIIKDLFEAFNELFLTVTQLISKLIPVAVFSSIFLMIIQTGVSSMMDMFGMAGTVILSLLTMMAVYGLLILLIGRLNPFIFFKKNLPGMLNAFTLSSSNASMPMNIQICTDKLGISPKVCNFSIPLGATVNMDGCSVYLAVTTLFLAKMYAVEIPGSAMLSIIITIIMLSLGTPGVPGASIVCMGVLLTQVGVPVEAVGIVMGVDALIDMCRTVSNTTGDMAVTLIVAKLEKLLDIEKYKSKC